MNFTFTEWTTIRHSLEVARSSYKDIADTCTPSDSDMSMYQIFKRQIAEVDALLDKLDNAVI